MQLQLASSAAACRSLFRLLAAHRSNASANNLTSAGGGAKGEQQASGLAKPALSDHRGKEHGYGNALDGGFAFYALDVSNERHSEL